ncbi:MAG: GvpL/GvpF family gas vesicle protein [Chloroflexaceae bacterium]|jgi:hypothetical protein|nr:GvpL/GvpF family gas vesicle protein [Chloroflexaceae bacterium]
MDIVTQTTRPTVNLASLADSFTPEEIADLVREAREAALAEVKPLLKRAMVEVLLAQVAGHVAAPRCDPAPAPDERTALLQEIAQIRKQLIANEEAVSALHDTPAPEVIAEPVPVPPPAAPAAAASDGPLGYYLFAVALANPNQKGVPDSGMYPDHAVYTLEHDGLRAYLSAVPLDEFGEEVFERNARNLTWLEPRARAHQAVVGGLAAEQTIIPLRFGTIFLTEERVRGLLTERRDEWVAALARLRGHQEWGVKVYCNLVTLGTELQQSSPRIQAFKNELEQKSQGAAYFMQRRLDMLIADEVEHFCDTHARQFHERFASHASAAVQNTVQSGDGQGSAERMLLNGAYLLSAEGMPVFYAELEHLKAEYSDMGFTYQLTGPWPPYNFVQR